MKILPFVIYLPVLWRSRLKSILLLQCLHVLALDFFLRKHFCFSMEETKTDISQNCLTFFPLYSLQTTSMCFTYISGTLRIFAKDKSLNIGTNKLGEGGVVIVCSVALMYLLLISVEEPAEKENDGNNLTTVPEFQYALHSLGFISCAHRNTGFSDIKLLDILPPVSTGSTVLE